MFFQSLLATFAKSLQHEDCSKLFNACRRFWNSRRDRVSEKNSNVLQQFEDGSIFDLHQPPISMHPGRLSNDLHLADDIISRRSLTLSAASSHSCLRVTSI